MREWPSIVPGTPENYYIVINSIAAHRSDGLSQRHRREAGHLGPDGSSAAAPAPSARQSSDRSIRNQQPKTRRVLQTSFANKCREINLGILVAIGTAKSDADCSLSRHRSH